jgi:hypothetical protein
MREREVFHYSAIPEDTVQLKSARSNILNSPLTYLLDHTVFDHYHSEHGYRVKKVIFIKDKLPRKEGKERENVGFILRIEHNTRGDFFFIRIKAGTSGEFNYITKAGTKKEFKLDRTIYPEGVNNNLIFALKNTFSKRKDNK